MNAVDPTALLRAHQEPIQRYLWHPRDMITFTPTVLSHVFGDGRALFGLTTINCRPAYWLIQGDSTWDVSDSRAPDDAPQFIDFVDDIVFAIEEEYGTVRCYERNCRGDFYDPETGRFVPRSWTAFPTMDDENGCSWWREDWPALEGLTLVPHPFARANMLGGDHVRGADSGQ